MSKRTVPLALGLLTLVGVIWLARGWSQHGAASAVAPSAAAARSPAPSAAPTSVMAEPPKPDEVTGAAGAAAVPVLVVPAAVSRAPAQPEAQKPATNRLAAPVITPATKPNPVRDEQKGQPAAVTNFGGRFY